MTAKVRSTKPRKTMDNMQRRIMETEGHRQEREMKRPEYSELVPKKCLSWEL